MRKISLFICVLGLAIPLASSIALAAPEGQNLNWGYMLNASDTACPSGQPVLNVTRKVINSVDSGTGLNDYGNVWWAYIDYVQQIQVVETAPGEFCATVKTQGSFISVGGDGPGCANYSTCNSSQGHLEAGVVGTFQGGATITFTGTFDPGVNRTRGSIGTLDHACDAMTPGGCSAPGFSAWQSEYFTGVASPSLAWWGWIYHGGNNGSWINAASGNEGNITGQ